MPGSVINSCLLAELMSINCAFFVPASFFSDFSDFGGGSDFFPVAFVWLNAEPVATQIARNTTNRLALVLLFIVLNSFVGSLSTLTGRTLLHTSGDNFCFHRNKIRIWTRQESGKRRPTEVPVPGPAPTQNSGHF